MIFTQESGLALRIYYAADCKRLDEGEGTDGLVEFSRRFQWAVTIFVLPSTADQLESPFVRRAMQLAHCTVTPANRQPPRFFVVSDTKQALDGLLHFADTISEQRTMQRNKFYQKIRNHNFRDEEASDAGAPEYSAAVSAVNQMAERMDFPQGETGVLLHVFKSIRGLTNVERSVLGQVPVDNRTKRLLLEFFKGQDRDGLAQLLEETSPEDVPNLCFSEPPAPEKPAAQHHGPSVLVDGSFQHPGRVTMGGTPTRGCGTHVSSGAPGGIPYEGRYCDGQPQQPQYLPYTQGKLNGAQYYRPQQQRPWQECGRPTPNEVPTMMVYGPFYGHHAPAPRHEMHPPASSQPIDPMGQLRSVQYELARPAAIHSITPPEHIHPSIYHPAGYARPAYHPKAEVRYPYADAGHGP